MQVGGTIGMADRHRICDDGAKDARDFFRRTSGIGKKVRVYETRQCSRSLAVVGLLGQ